MRTAIGLVEVTSVARVAPETITEADARRAGATSRAELLARLDSRNREHPIHEIGVRFAGPDPRVALREHADLTDDELGRISARLDRLDNARAEPWTQALLELIEQQPATLAGELAEQTGRELLAFKRDVRKLKELGLTESLKRGYRLSPRGRAVLAHTRA